MARYGDYKPLSQPLDVAPQAVFWDNHTAIADEVSPVREWGSSFEILEFKPVNNGLMIQVNCLNVTADSTFSIEIANDEAMTVGLNEYATTIVKAGHLGEVFLRIDWATVLADYPNVATSKQWFVRLKTVTTGCTYTAQFAPYQHNLI